MDCELTVFGNEIRYCGLISDGREIDDPSEAVSDTSLLADWLVSGHLFVPKNILNSPSALGILRYLLTCFIVVHWLVQVGLVLYEGWQRENNVGFVPAEDDGYYCSRSVA